MESLEPACVVLRHRSRYDLANLLSRASVRFVESHNDFGYVEITVQIQAPLSEYDRLKALSQEDTQKIKEAIIDVWSERAEDAPVEHVVYRLDRNSLTNGLRDIDDSGGQSNAITSMRSTDKVDLIDRIGGELQARYTFRDIDVFLGHFGIEPPGPVSPNTKRVYAKAALNNASDSVLAKIVDDLNIGPINVTVPTYLPPNNWIDSGDFRLFISHIAKHKDKATRLKECLDQYAISGFVSHEDINPTLEWQTEIERALKCMDAMVTIHTKGFQRSWWTQQEIGFALCRSVKVISLKFDEDPTGFIARNQALARRGRSADAIAEEIDRLLLDDDRTRERLEAAKSARDQLAVGDMGLPFLT